MIKKVLALGLGALLSLTGLTGSANAAQTITFTAGGVVPSPYNAYDSSWCSWRGGQNIDSNADGTRLIVADAKNYNCGGTPVNRFIYLSSDGGSTFLAANGLPSAAWGVVSSSQTGQYLAAGAHPGNLYTSSNYGASWTLAATPGVKPWWDIKMSDDGSFMIATYDYGSLPYVSTDFGATWSALAGFNSGSYRDLGVSADGKVVAVCKNDGNATNNGARIMISRTGSVPTNFSSFTEVIDRPSGVICGSIDMDATGTRLASLTWTNDSVAIWSYSSSTWSVVSQFTETWMDGYNGISMSSDGQTIFMPGWDQKPDYVSFDGGATSQYINVADLATRIGVGTVSRDGSKLIQIGSDRAYVASLSVSGNIAPQQQQQVAQPMQRVTGLSGRNAIVGTSSTMVLHGEGLAGVTTVSVGGVSVEVLENTSSMVSFKSPISLLSGTFDIKLETPTLRLTFQDALVVSVKAPDVTKPSVKTVFCTRGKKKIKLTSANPKCPTGYSKG